MPDPSHKHSLLARLRREFAQLVSNPVQLADEAERFRRWAATRPAENRTGEWECDYVRWDILQASAIDLLDSASVADLTEEYCRSVVCNRP